MRLPVGAFGMFIAAGRGVLLVPILLREHHLLSADTVGPSRAPVFSNALLGSIAYTRQRRVDLSVGWRFAATTAPRASGDAHLARALSPRLRSPALGAVRPASAVRQS